DWVDRAGLVESGHKLSKHELRVEQSDSVASSTPSEEKVDKGGRAEETREEKWVGERLRRLLRDECIGARTESCSMSRTSKRMKKWSERCRGVTVRLSVVQFRARMRSSSFPALCVGGVGTCCRSNE